MSSDERSIEYESARLAHAAANKGMDSEMSMVAGFGNAAMRAPALAAAGGIAALLGFYSANAIALRGTTAVADFNAALLAFFIAVLACVAAPGCAYISQAFFIWSKGQETHHFDRPFVRETKKSKRLFAVGTLFQLGAALLTLGAIVALVIGGLSFMRLADFTASHEPQETASPGEGQSQ
ncbi:hypothetical protein FY036_15850 [Mesorhizobium microcysteis]|uniref:Uncharacterized protein n=1 Tax=Neoaquamicrobium microcysteis TaxID=2682781 RepID=A0A5D4GSP6_9HYPH|nr:hypothetical protein [Mesorhizobium microcysteis]TYR30923.1 hypothetical protein FY036_15850 [Mesorhizobium microcysteis]